MIIGDKSCIWIFGHSYIYWAHKRAAQRCYGSNLSLPADKFVILWKGIRGLQWTNLFLHISELFHSWPYPSMIILHVGGNDVGRLKTLDLMFLMKQDLHRLRLMFPNTCVVFSEMVSRLHWLYSKDSRPLEKIKRRINHSIEKFLPSIGGISFRHVDLEGGFPGLYRQDGVHLSDVGLDIFNLGLQNCIEQAAVLG